MMTQNAIRAMREANLRLSSFNIWITCSELVILGGFSVIVLAAIVAARAAYVGKGQLVYSCLDFCVIGLAFILFGSVIRIIACHKMRNTANESLFIGMTEEL